MKYLSLETFNDFVCIGDKCPFTCCAGGWRIIIDDDTYKYYMTVSGDFGERLRDSIQCKNGINSFILNERGRCPFLNERELCDIYINLGEEHLSCTCTNYPRYMFYVGDIGFAGVSISCPEVSRFFLSRKEPLLIDYSEDRINYEDNGKTDWKLFNSSTRVFTNIVSIAQNRALNIRERYALIVVFTFQFQKYVDESRETDDLISLFSNPDDYIQLIHQTGVYQKDYSAKISFFTDLMNYYGHLKDYKIIIPEVSELIDYFSKPDNTSFEYETLVKAFEWIDTEDNQIWLENVSVYLIYKYFMQGFDNRDFYNKMLIGLLLVFNVVISVLSLYRLMSGENAGFDYKVLLIARISRLAEHNDSFRDRAMDYFEQRHMDELPFLIRYIS